MPCLKLFKYRPSLSQDEAGGVYDLKAELTD
jgi:hypothetical protein